MADSPLITVVVPCFNYQRYVALAIESALGQSYERKEILVIDDGSSDDSAAVIDRYQGRVSIVHQENRGHVRSCERGLKESRGDIVIFLDADDLLSPNSLQVIAEAWEPSCTKVQYDVAIIDGAGSALGRRFCHFDRGYDKERVRHSFRETGTYRWPVTVGNAYSRWFLEQVFPLTVDIAPDGLLNTVAPVYGDVVTVPDVLACYRIHGKNGWSTNGTDDLQLGRRIAHRRTEIAVMRDHALRLGVTVPGVDVLDHELAFLNYRLMALKLEPERPGATPDSAMFLLGRALKQLAREALPLRLTLTHALWFAVLSAAPPSLARNLIRMRLTRGAGLTSVARRLKRLRKPVTPA